MQKKIAGYEVINWNDTRVTKLMGLRRAMEIAHTCDCKGDYQHHIQRKYVNGEVEWIVSVTEHTLDSYACAPMTHRENNIATKFAEEMNLKKIGPA
jgi:hypothetical protein